MAKVRSPQRTNEEIRQVLLEYFYQRNKNGRSARSDKTGVAAKISIIRRDLKASYGLSQSEIWSNLTYLISMGWVEEDRVIKNVPLPTGIVIPQSTAFYKITAAGIDKLEGPGVFTMAKSQGIKIEANGQNTVTVGDGNKVEAHYSGVAHELAELRKSFLNCESISGSQKLENVADIEKIQSHLANPKPDKSVIRTIWSAIEKAATAVGLTSNLARISGLLP